jgi:hypothetical protein
LANLYDKKTSAFYKLSKRVRSWNQVFGDQFWSKKNKAFNYLVLIVCKEKSMVKFQFFTPSITGRIFRRKNKIRTPNCGELNSTA